jgi:hypothetical protein
MGNMMGNMMGNCELPFTNERSAELFEAKPAVTRHPRGGRSGGRSGGGEARDSSWLIDLFRFRRRKGGQSTNRHSHYAPGQWADGERAGPGMGIFQNAIARREPIHLGRSDPNPRGNGKAHTGGAHLPSELRDDEPHAGHTSGQCEGKLWQRGAACGGSWGMMSWALWLHVEVPTSAVPRPALPSFVSMQDERHE